MSDSSSAHTSSMGTFSVSLAVKDLKVSKAFYLKLGFESVAGDEEQNWLILANGPVKIGLFQGMFEANIMTFNPGWDASGQPLESFTDIRALQKELKQGGVEFVAEVDADTTGPGSFIVVDPDGNTIMADQHV